MERGPPLTCRLLYIAVAFPNNGFVVVVVAVVFCCCRVWKLRSPAVIPTNLGHHPSKQSHLWK